MYVSIYKGTKKRPPKLLFSIKKLPPKPHNLLYIFICIVPINYNFS